MPTDVTRAQIDALALDPGRPIVVCDVDEVVVHFTRDFEACLEAQGLWLDAASLALDGNIRRRDSGEAVAPDDVDALIERFFIDRTRHLEPIDNAIEALLEIGEQASVVMLTNLPHSSAEDRRVNLKGHGLDFPVVTNSGPKGPAVRRIAGAVRRPAVFIDDNPSFIASVRDHAPHVHLVHFVHDERFARFMHPMDFISLRTGAWTQARPHILGLIGSAGRQSS